MRMDGTLPQFSANLFPTANADVTAVARDQPSVYSRRVCFINLINDTVIVIPPTLKR